MNQGTTNGFVIPDHIAILLFRYFIICNCNLFCYFESQPGTRAQTTICFPDTTKTDPKFGNIVGMALISLEKHVKCML